MNQSFVSGAILGLLIGITAMLIYTKTLVVGMSAAHDSGVVKPTGAIIRSLQESAEREDFDGLAAQIALLNTRWSEFDRGGTPPEGFMDEIVESGRHVKPNR